MWIICGLHTDSMDFEMLWVHKHLDSTWNMPGLQVYSSKTPWVLPGLHLESRWSPPQPVAQYNDLILANQAAITDMIAGGRCPSVLAVCSGFYKHTVQPLVMAISFCNLEQNLSMPSPSVSPNPVHK